MCCHALAPGRASSHHLTMTSTCSRQKQMLEISALQTNGIHTQICASCINKLTEDNRFLANFCCRGELLTGNKEGGLPGAHLLHQQVFKQCTSDIHCVLRLDPAMPALLARS